MTTELAAITTRPAIAKTITASTAAIEMLRAHAEMMAVAHNLASAMVKTSMVPQHFRGKDKAEDATAAILYGAEVGLNPIQALQTVIPIHGKPSLEARTMVALLENQGYVFDTVEKSDESVTITCTPPVGKPETSTWTIERARLAGYVAKWDQNRGDWVRNANGKIAGNTKYLTDPQAMLWAKAAGELCRHKGAAVLLGMPYSREDLESEPEPAAPAPVHVVSERADAAAVVDGVPDEPVDIADLTAEPDPEPPADEAAEAAPPGPEPAPAKRARAKRATPPALTDAQLATLEEHFVALKVPDDSDRLRIAAQILDRSVGALAELTEAEADRLIAELVDARAADAAPSEGADQ